MPDAIPPTIRVSGRTFSPPDLALIRDIVVGFPNLSLTELSRTVCELLRWTRRSGRLKDYECRLLLERLQREEFICLPRLLPRGPRGPLIVVRTRRCGPHAPINVAVGDLGTLSIEVIRGGGPNQTDAAAVWREYIDRYHYLGYRVPVGANLRYSIRCAKYPDVVLACLLWSSPAWRLETRDKWIGWNDRQREEKLQLIVNNSRFLILPWVRVSGLASRILAQCARQLPRDWERLYGYRPVLLETLVDGARFAGTCYRAANWVMLGWTKGRGRMDQALPRNTGPKMVYAYPLCREFREKLAVDRISSAAPANQGVGPCNALDDAERLGRGNVGLKMPPQTDGMSGPHRGRALAD